MSDLESRVGNYQFTGTADRHHVIEMRDLRLSYKDTAQLVLTDGEILDLMVFLLALMRGE